MTRNNSVNFTGPLQYPIADAATDLFKKEDVQVATKALDLHDHTTGKGLPITSIPNGTITSAMIADGTIVAGDIADGAITSAKILDGTIATGDHADASITNAKLASDTARLNLLVNGGIEVWQRGAGPFTTNGGYTADRWMISVGGTSTMSISRVGSTMGTYQYSLQAAYTHAAGGSGSVLQPLNDQAIPLRNLAVTLAMWVKSNVAGSVSIGIQDSAGTTASGTNTSANVAQRLTVTRTIDAAATALYAMVYVSGANASCTVEINDATLVVGSQAADYAPMHPADDLARCLRYYEVAGGSANQYLSAAQAYSTTNFLTPWRFRAQKAVVPTITNSGPAGFICSNATSGALALSGLSSGTIAVDGGSLIGSVGSGLVAGNATVLQSNGGAIFVEANP